MRNVTPFGCFVNVGLKDDGLLHVSELRKRAGGPGGGPGGGPSASAGRAPPFGAPFGGASALAAFGGGGGGLEGVFVGQLLDLVVLSVDVPRRRLSLGLPPREGVTTEGGSGAGGTSGGNKRTAAPSGAGTEQSAHSAKRHRHDHR